MVVSAYKDDGRTRTDESLLEHAVKNAGSKSADRRCRRWHVKSLFSLGSSSSYDLCVRFGVDPGQLVGGCHQCGESESRECACGRADWAE